MSRQNRTDRHEQVVRETIDRYRAEGYEVDRGDRSARLPEFLNGYVPDLIAAKESESVLIEVRDRSCLARDRDLRLLPGLVADRTGWRFDLVLFDAEAGDGPPSGEGREPNSGEIHARVEQAERMLSEGRWEAAHLIAWAAAEAGLRELARDHELSSGDDPLSMLTALVFDGHVSQEEYARLRQALRTRNALAHGRVVPVDADSTRGILSFVTSHLPSGTAI